MMSPALAPAPAPAPALFFAFAAAAAAASASAPASASASAATSAGAGVGPSATTDASFAPSSATPAPDSIRYGCGGGLYRIVATPAQTRRTHFAFEAIEPPGGGPPLHVHTREEEFFLVLEGDVTFSVNGELRRRGPGGTAFVPRGVPHCFKNMSDRPARLLVLFTPGEIEGFFEYGAPLPDGSAPSEQVLRDRLMALAPRYGLDVLGPSPL